MGGDNEKLKKNGLPEIAADTSSYKFAYILPIATSAIGLGITFGINYYGDSASFAKKIAAVKALDGHWIYASAFLFSKLTQVLNNIPMRFKDKIMTMKSGNLRANMLFFKSLGGNKADEALIGLESEGAVGEYNRANRSLHHFVESSLGFVMSFTLAAYVFPKESLAVMATFCVGRIMHQIGYTTGYGSHGVGFSLSNLLSGATIDGMNLFVVGKSFGIF